LGEKFRELVIRFWEWLTIIFSKFKSKFNLEIPPEPVTLADQLGVDNIEMGDNLTEFLEAIQEELDVPLDSLETAVERQEEEQAEADAAMMPITYTTPSQIEVATGPVDPQILDLKLYQKFVIHMRDSNGNIMPNVGFVTDPWTVSISLSNTVTNGPDTPSIDGTTVVQFKPADGRATFDDVLVKGDVESTQFTFKGKVIKSIRFRNYF